MFSKEKKTDETNLKNLIFWRSQFLSKNLAQAQLNNFQFIRSLEQEDFFFQFTYKFYKITQFKN